jgi:NADH-ubiquinone oxidoreductase chain 2
VYEDKEENDTKKYKNEEVINKYRSKDENTSPIQLISQLKGYYYINPMLALSLCITLFSFVGVPPLIGFFGKQMILSAALDNGYVFMTLVAILTSVISAVYYLAVIKQIFFEKPSYKLNPILNDLNLNCVISDGKTILKKTMLKANNIVISGSLSLIISILTLIILLFIFIPQEWLSMSNILALILFNV